VEQPHRALDVGAEEHDDAGGPGACHDPIMEAGGTGVHIQDDALRAGA
jgi:hypothetical protein